LGDKFESAKKHNAELAANNIAKKPIAKTDSRSTGIKGAMGTKGSSSTRGSMGPKGKPPTKPSRKN
jgi:hypothetical protein